MHPKKQRGGKRPGAGRKPIADPKTQISVYIARSTIERYGGATEIKKVIYNLLKHENEL